ncbi:hypothetical protein [Streptomyces sp. NBC_01022]|uniref:hypothetical protein n=1 Tax=Streptomyces sp. NBC_01022 TaxID=2903723 RepID=UPI002DDA7451|nr:hypothetical protein [Streptomyces sp. NBC_01022]WRZ80673.1 hypothetical protein OG316_10505 [Streptomyces sp. NBC_01022]
MATKSPAAPRTSFVRERFSVFSECLLTGVWITVAALPLVTFPAAFAAGSRHLHRYLAGEAGGLREFAADVREAFRSGWRVSLLWWAALALLAFDWQVARSGLLPGGRPLMAVSLLGLPAVAVWGLRTAAAWHPGTPWAQTVRTAGRRTFTDPAGSLLLVGGFVALALATWQIPPLAAPALGCLAAAAVAADRR